MELPVTPGFETDDERFEVPAKLGWLEGELRRMGWVHAAELGRLTAILCQRIDDLEAQFTADLIEPIETSAP